MFDLLFCKIYVKYRLDNRGRIIDTIQIDDLKKINITVVFQLQ